MAYAIGVLAEQTNLGLDAYVTAGKQSLTTAVTNYKQVEERHAKLSDGTPVHLFGGTFMQNQLHIRILQAIAIKNGVAIVVTAGTTEAAWDQYKTVFEKVLLSYK